MNGRHNRAAGVDGMVSRTTYRERRVLMDLYDQCLRSEKQVGGVPVDDRTTLQFLIEEGFVRKQDLIDGISQSAVFWLTDNGMELCRAIHRDDQTRGTK